MKEQILNWLTGTLLLAAILSAVFSVMYLCSLWPPLFFVLLIMALGWVVGEVFGGRIRRWAGRWKVEADLIARKLWRG